MPLTTLGTLEPAGDCTQALKLFTMSQLAVVGFQHSPLLAYSITATRMSDAKMNGMSLFDRKDTCMCARIHV